MSFLNRIGGGRVGAKPPKRSPTTPSSPFFNQDGSPGQGNGQSGSYFAQGGQNQSPSGKPLYLCQPFVKAALVKGNFKNIVSLPKYVDVNEWVAVNLVDLFNNLNLFYAVVTEACTNENCPTMSAGPGMDYTWVDKTHKRIKLPAPQYIDFVLTWVEGLIKDETVFPTKAGRDFSPNFPSVARHIYTQLLRVFAHLYHAHYPHFLHLSCEGHLNSLFAHFLTFGKEFDLLEPKECRAPKEGFAFVVGDLMDAWKGLAILTEA